jgi:predicted acetyltransferase
MTRPASHSSVQLEVIPAAPEQEPILANLLELYMHDFSELLAIDLGEDGRYGYEHLSLYWTEATRHPFLIRADGKLAGFALVKKGSEISGDDRIWDVAEFFVVRGYRKRGIGTAAAHEVWRRFPGPWEVRVMVGNVPAYRFWAGAVAAFVGEIVDAVPVEKVGKCWNVFSFSSKPA